MKDSLWKINKKSILKMAILSACLIFYVLLSQNFKTYFIFQKGSKADSLFYAVTTQLFHINLIHLLLNLLAAIEFTRKLLAFEAKAKIALLAAMAFGTIGTALLLFAADGVTYMGASGVVIALFGYLLTKPVQNEQDRLYRFSELIGLIGFTLVIPNISWLMHATGLITGLAMGGIDFLRQSYIRKKRNSPE